MPRTLLFDMAEVLIVGLNGVEVPIEQCCHVPPETVLPALSGAWFHDLAAGHTAEQTVSPEIAIRRDWFYDLMCGRIDEDTYWDAIIRREGWQTGVDDLKRIMRRHFDQAIPGMEALVRRLAERYALALLSDHGREWIDYIEPVHGWLQVIPDRYYSFDIGAMKRDGIAFDYVLGKLGIEPSDCVFVDDNPMNIAVAGRLGIDGILFKSAEQLEAALPDHGIQPG